MNFKLVTFVNFIVFFIAFKSFAAQVAVSGSDLSFLVIKHLTNLGIESTPAINKNRVFFGCAKENILINRRYLSWKTIQVKCQGNNRWSYTFRNKIDNSKSKPLVSREPKIEEESPVIKKRKVFVLAEDKLKGDKIKKTDILLSDVNNFLTKDAFEEMKPILGKELKRTLRKGTIIKKNHLQPSWLVYKNQRVIIENSLGEIRVTMEGVALKNGAKGDRILVRNVSSNKTVEGFVDGEKKITIFRKIY